MTVFVASAVFPALSAVVSLTWNVPALVNVCEAFTPLPLAVLSPQDHV